MGEQSSIVVPARRLPRSFGDACLAALAFALRTLVLFVAAVLALVALDQLVKQLDSDEVTGWLEISIGDANYFPLWLGLAWGLFLFVGVARKAHAIVISDLGVELRLRLGRTLVLGDIHTVTRVGPAASFFAMCWPRWPSDFRTSVATARGWYRVAAARRAIHICPSNEDLFESTLRERLRIVPAAARRGFGKAAAGWTRSFFASALAVVPLIFLAGLFALPRNLSEPRFDSSSTVLLKWSLPKLDPGKDRDKWTALLVRAVSKGDAAFVKEIVEAGVVPEPGSRPVFPLAGYPRHPCGQSLEEMAKGDKPIDPELAQLLRHVRFRFADGLSGGELMFGLECVAKNPARHLPLALYLDAARRLPAEELRSLPQRFSGEFLVIALRGDPELRRFAVDLLQPGLEARLENEAPVIRFLEILARLEDWDLRRLGIKDWDSAVAASRPRPAGGPLRGDVRPLVEGLVRAPADLGAVDAGGRSVAYYAASLHLGWLAERALAVSGPKVRTKAGATLLHAAAAGGDVNFAKRLVAAGVSPRDATHDGRTPLHYAKGWEMVFVLREQGLDPSARDQRGRTPLHDAALRGDLEAARTLIAFGAQRDARDLFGNRPIDYAPKEPPRPKPAPKSPARKAPAASEQPSGTPVWVLWEELLRVPDAIGGPR